MYLWDPSTCLRDIDFVANIFVELLDPIYITKIPLIGREYDALVGKNCFRSFDNTFYAGDLSKVCIKSLYTFYIYLKRIKYIL